MALLKETFIPQHEKVPLQSAERFFLAGQLKEVSARKVSKGIQ
jgi:hypothetical protein